MALTLSINCPVLFRTARMLPELNVAHAWIAMRFLAAAKFSSFVVPPSCTKILLKIKINKKHESGFFCFNEGQLSSYFLFGRSLKKSEPSLSSKVQRPILETPEVTDLQIRNYWYIFAMKFPLYWTSFIFLATLSDDNSWNVWYNCHYTQKSLLDKHPNVMMDLRIRNFWCWKNWPQLDTRNHTITICLNKVDTWRRLSKTAHPWLTLSGCWKFFVDIVTMKSMSCRKLLECSSNIYRNYNAQS